jgi:hypothetical protein
VHRARPGAYGSLVRRALVCGLHRVLGGRLRRLRRLVGLRRVRCGRVRQRNGRDHLGCVHGLRAAGRTRPSVPALNSTGFETPASAVNGLWFGFLGAGSRWVGSGAGLNRGGSGSGFATINPNGAQMAYCQGGGCTISQTLPSSAA